MTVGTTRIEAIRTHLSGRLGHAVNEDRLLLSVFSGSAQIVGVADGATPKTPWRNADDRTSGYLAADVVVARVALIGPETKPQEWFDAFLEAVLDMRDREGVPADEATVATFALYNGFRNEIWLRGDCQHAWLRGASWEVFEKEQGTIEAEQCRARSERIKDLLGAPENGNWENDEQIRRHVATEGWKASLAVRRNRQMPSATFKGLQHLTPDENASDEDPSMTIIALPADASLLALGTDGLVSLRPSVEDTIALRSDLASIDPFLIGMGGNDFLTPKGLVDKDSGEIVSQFDDEAAVWISLKR